MERCNADAVWTPVETGEFDEDGEPFFDYVLSGSEPLDPFEAMVFAAAGVDMSLEINPYSGAY